MKTSLILTMFLSALFGALLAITYVSSKPIVVDWNTPMIERWETADGEEIMPPVTTTLGAYIDSRNHSLIKDFRGFQNAFEKDLHVKDDQFHNTHAYIDGCNF